MDGNYKIYHGDTLVAGNIQSKERADLGYSLLMYMTAEESEINGVKFGSEALRLEGPDGKQVEAKLDPEFFDIREDYMNMLLDEKQKAAEEAGEEFDRNKAMFDMESYSVFASDEDDFVARFAPYTYDINKAREMKAFMADNIDPSVDISCDGIQVSGRNIVMVNGMTEMIEDEQEDDFAAAVASIPADVPVMEQ